ncbi:MAG: UDP-N-acetylmuramate:L-alanyl-gamma-D-glutamyl-meso-diaminopimelate ligase [Deltaproteobacteria bacterium]|nr:UDP-N-acetylmuramate:L-alanyl-gamma-D-glutamyl-meso-diaminopimelate ligase [Deltaproteobacteria bacterium]
MRLGDGDGDREVRKVHVMGVGGTAMSAITGLLREAGCEVRGSDASQPYPPMSTLLERLGIAVMHPYDPANLAWGPDLVVVGNVIRRTNPEAIAAVEAGLPCLSMPQVLRAAFLEGRRPLVIAGTHGKTTTTSLLAHLLDATGFDPGMMVGGIPLDFGSNYRLGSGAPFVVEGDEYDTAYFDKGPKFLHYAPQAAIVNNVEFDHADIFADLERVVAVFASFAAIVPAGAPLVVPAEDANCLRAVADSPATRVTFGLAAGDWRPSGVVRTDGRVRFVLEHAGRPVGRFDSPLIGEHNLRNTVAALALVHETGLATPGLAHALASFKGVRKRQEVRGTVRGVTVIDDFAHHPTAVRETLRAVREAYPGARVVALFEPESNTSRRRVFQDEFAVAFAAADEVLFYKPLEKPDNLRPEERIDMDRLCAAIEARGVPARMIPDIDALAAAAADDAQVGDVIVGMSGRDFLGVHGRVLGRLGRP